MLKSQFGIDAKVDYFGGKYKFGSIPAVVFPSNKVISEVDIEEDHIDEILDSGVKTILIHKEDQNQQDFAIIYNTLQKDTSNSEKEAVEHIYRQLRNAEPPDYETAKNVFEKLFFSDTR